LTPPTGSWWSGGVELLFRWKSQQSDVVRSSSKQTNDLRASNKLPRPSDPTDFSPRACMAAAGSRPGTAGHERINHGANSAAARCPQLRQ